MEKSYHSVKILHCADVHLGSDFKALGTKSRARKADLNATFSRTIRFCESENVNILMIAGDLFDGWNLSETDYEVVRDQFASIPNTKIVIAAGNHDPAAHATPYQNGYFNADNVFIMPSEFGGIVFDDIKTEVWGASFASVYAENSLLGKAKPQNPDYIQLGIIHGSVGSKSQNEIYNPITPAQIAESGVSYLALGHVHTHSGIQKSGKTSYAYSGCLDGRGFDEVGEKGVVVGTISNDGVCDLRFKAMSGRIYQTLKIDITECINMSEIANCIRKELEKVELNQDISYKDNLYKIYLLGRIGFSLNLDNIKSYLDDIFFIKLRDKTEIEIDLDDTATEQSLRGVFVRRYLEEESKALKPAEKLALTNALNIGLKAFAGEVDFYED